ncbi:MAG: MFS superfamily sulfate permease-like transporter [Candidatus Arcticimaribacter sp.]|jgi:MFS superfamily sulfate permease-like transporter
MYMNYSNPLKNFKNDFPASVVVFFVAIPLCLGIALASGAPLFSGLIAEIIGGVFVGVLSGFQVGVIGNCAYCN